MMGNEGIVANAAKNGRLYCTLLVIINLIAGWPIIAWLAALPVGIAVIGDGLAVAERDHASVVVMLASYAITAVAVIATLIAVW